MDASNRVERGPPPTTALRDLRRLSHILDEAVRVPGTDFRVGLDPLIGLLPGAGDLVSGGLSIYGILVAHRLGAPGSVILRMAGNVVLDTVLGSIPLVGDLFDAGWKANTRNLRILETFLEQPRRVHARSRFMVVVVLALLLALIIAGVAFAIWLASRLFALL